MSTFHYALKPDGFLFLGASESIGNFVSADRQKAQTLYQKGFQLPNERDGALVPPVARVQRGNREGRIKRWVKG